LGKNKRWLSWCSLSVWDVDGAVVVYDAHTVEEMKRLPMVKPTGNYNVFQ